MMRSHRRDGRDRVRDRDRGGRAERLERVERDEPERALPRRPAGRSDRDRDRERNRERDRERDRDRERERERDPERRRDVPRERPRSDKPKKAFPFQNLTQAVLKYKGSNSRSQLEVIAAEFNPVGSKIAATKTDGSIYVWKVNVKTNEPMKSEPVIISKTHKRMADAISWRPDSDEILATVGRDQYVKIWNAVKGDCSLSVDTGETSLNSIAYSTDSKYIVVTSTKNNMLILDSKTLETVQTISFKENVFSMCWCNSSDALFVGMGSGTIALLTRSKEDGLLHQRQTLDGHRSTINAMCVDPHGRYLAAGSHEGVISIWSLSDLSVVKTIGDVDQSIKGLDIHSSGAYIGVTYRDADTAKLYSLEDGKQVMNVEKCTVGAQLDPVFRFSPVNAGYFFTDAHGEVTVGADF